MPNPTFPRVHPTFSWMMRSTAACVVITTTPSVSLAGPDLPDGMTDLAGLLDRATAVSADGRTVVGSARVQVGSEFFDRASRWTVGEEPEIFEFAREDTCDDTGGFVSAGGDFFYGMSLCGGFPDNFGVRWDADGAVILDDSPAGITQLRGMSADGTAVVGMSTEAGFTRGARWTAEDGTVRLDDVPDAAGFSFASGISANGQTIIGSGFDIFGNPFAGETVPVAWLDGGTAVTGLGFLDPDHPFGVSRAVSGDGTTIVGTTGFNSPDGNNAFIWTEADGMQDIPGFRTANRIAPDGSWVIGTSDDGEPAVWRPGLGIISLADWLDELGFQVPEPYRSTILVLDITDDLRTFVGTDALFGTPSYFVHYTLPEDACTGDLDGSGVVDFGDMLSVLENWGDAGGDVNGDGTTDSADVLVLLAAWGPCS